MATVLELPVKSHFGDCPKCKKNDGHLNIGRSHWFYCKRHRVKWRAGDDIFPNWKHEDETTWKQNEELLNFFLEIEPYVAWNFSSDEEILALYNEPVYEPAYLEQETRPHLALAE